MDEGLDCNPLCSQTPSCASAPPSSNRNTGPGWTRCSTNTGSAVSRTGQRGSGRGRERRGRRTVSKLMIASDREIAGRIVGDGHVRTERHQRIQLGRPARRPGGTGGQDGRRSSGHAGRANPRKNRPGRNLPILIRLPLRTGVHPAILQQHADCHISRIQNI